MSEEDISVIATAGTSRTCVKSVKVDDTKLKNNKYSKLNGSDGEKQTTKKKKLQHRVPSFQSAVARSFGSFRNSFRKLHCFKNQEEEELPMLDIPRHKSIDIGVGLARRMSLFLFTRRTVCVHPYHPYTPEQTTRKIYIFSEEQ